MLSDALGEVTRGLEVVEFACGMPHLLKGGFSEGVSTKVDVYSIRQPLGVVGDHHAVQLPGDGPDVVLPDRDRRRQHRRGQAEREGPERRRTSSPSCGPRPACPPACSTSCTVTRWPSTALLDHPDVKSISFVGSTPIARYVYETRHAPAASACRPSAGPRTTWSCCPTPTSTWPPTPRSTPASAPPASAAWRSRRSSAVERRRRRAGREDRGADGHAEDRRRPARLRHGPAGHRRAPRQGRVLRAGRRSTPARRLVVDGRDPTVDGEDGGFWLGTDAVRPRHHRHEHLHRRDLRAGALGAAGRLVRRGGRPRQRQPVRQRHRHLHQRRRCGPALPERDRGRHGRHQRADPGADVVLLLRRLEGVAVRRHPRPRRRGRPLLHPRQGRHAAAGSTRATAA